MCGDGCESCKFKRKWFWGKVEVVSVLTEVVVYSHSVSNEGGIFEANNFFCNIIFTNTI